MKLYNTLSRSLEEFVPVNEGQVNMYNCGPTVYNYIHVGNARPLVIFDTLRRYFIYKGYDVNFVVNFTDIDDKIINRANEEHVDFTEISERYIEEFKKDANGLHLYDYKTINPRATEMIPQMIEFIKTLEYKDAAYVLDGDVYFDITKAKDYGKLSKKNIDELMAGARIGVAEGKRNPGDFVLWKKKKEGEPAWDSPWAEGRPGWHIECSVMAKTILGDTIDIHSGGEDLQFPHHENEIAQSETANDKTFANYWLHNGMINVDNEKMSKSRGNFFTIREVSKEYDLEILRYFLLTCHYRSPINFSHEVMEQCKASLERMYNGKEKLEKLIETAKSGSLDEEVKALVDAEVKYFEDAMENDINTADALTAIFNIIKIINTKVDDSSKETLEYVRDNLNKTSKVLGILERKEEGLSPEEEALFNERLEARKNKDYAKSDELRDKLLEMGIEVKDSREGTTWKRI